MEKIYSKYNKNNIEDVVRRVEILIQAKNIPELRSFIDSMDKTDITEIVLRINLNYLRDFVITIELEPYMIPNLDSQRANLIFEYLGPETFARIINKFKDWEFYDFIHHHIDIDTRENFSAYLDFQKKRILDELLSYPEDSAARIMQKGLTALPDNFSIKQIIEHLSCSAEIDSNLSRIFFVDAQNNISGLLLIAELFMHASSTIAREIMDKRFMVVPFDTHQKKVAQLFQCYSLSFALVTNIDYEVIGIITLDDVIDVVEEEADDSMMHLQYVATAEDYERHGIFASVKVRVPWIFINVILSMLVSSFVGRFAYVIEEHVALAVLVPIIASISGISGSQSIANTIHVISKENISKGEIFHTFVHEILAIIFIALIMAFIAGIFVFFRFDEQIAILFFIAMLCTFTIASFSGIIVPCLTHFILKLDPTIVSPILVTTLSDFAAYLFSLLLALWILS